MAREREVRLVISARDEASKVLRRVRESLSGLSEAQKILGNRTLDAKARFFELAKAMSALPDMAAFAKLKSDVKDAAAAVSELKRRVSEAASAEQQLAQATEKAADRVKAYAQALSNTRKAIADNKARVADLQKEIKSLSSAHAAASRTRDKARKSMDALSAKMAELSGKLAEQKARWREVVDAIAQTDSPTKKMLRQRAALEKSMASTRDKLRKLAEQWKAQVKLWTKADTELAQLSKQLAKSNDELADREKQLKRLAEKEDLLATALAEAEGKYKELAGALDKAASDHRRLVSELEKADQYFRELSATVDSVEKAYQDLGAAVDTAINRALVESRASLSSMERAWRALYDEASRYEQMLEELGIEDKKHAAIVDDLRQRASKLKEEWRNSQREVDRLTEALRRATPGSREFELILRQLGATLAKMDASSKQARQELSQLVNTTRKVRTEAAALRAETQAADTAFKRFALAVRRAAVALRELNRGQRTTLSYAQRIRGQLLALLAAYTGVYAIPRGIGNLLETQQRWDRSVRALATSFQEVEKSGKRAVKVIGYGVTQIVQPTKKAAAAISQTSQSIDEFMKGWSGRFTDLLDTSQKTLGPVGDEMRRLWALSNEMGMEFETVAAAFSKIAVVAQANRVPLEDTRRLFKGLMVTFGGAGLSADQFKRAFVAIIQMMGKGKVQMEELRQQLGEQVYTALIDMARAAGYTAENMDAFFKAVKDGEITLKDLIKFGELSSQRWQAAFGMWSQSAMAAFNRMKNGWFAVKQAMNEAGLMEALTRLFNKMYEVFTSREFLEFARMVGRGAAKVIDALTYMVEHWKTTATVIGVVLGGLSFTAVATFARMAFSIIGFTGRMVGTILSLGGAARLVGGAFSAVTPTVVSWGSRILGVLRMIPGPIGLIASALGLGAAAWWYFSGSSAKAEESMQKAGRAAALVKDEVGALSQEAQMLAQTMGQGVRLDVSVAGAEQLSRAKVAVDGMAEEAQQAQGSFDQLTSAMGKTASTSKQVDSLSKRLALLNKNARTAGSVAEGLARTFHGITQSATLFAKTVRDMADSLKELVSLLAMAQQPLAAFAGAAGGVQNLGQALRDAASAAVASSSSLHSMQYSLSGVESRARAATRALLDMARAAREAAAASANVRHSGGIIGLSGARRIVDPMIFAGAMRYHTGGIVGLAPGEVPAILKRGEEVLTRSNPRHIMNASRRSRSDGGLAGAVSMLVAAVRELRATVASLREQQDGVDVSTLGRVLARQVFGRLPRYHEGGLVRLLASGGAGLRPDEVPAILLEGEEVLTPDDPRHTNNMRRGVDWREILDAVPGAADAMDAALQSLRQPIRDLKRKLMDAKDRALAAMTRTLQSYKQQMQFMLGAIGSWRRVVGEAAGIYDGPGLSGVSGAAADGGAGGSCEGWTIELQDYYDYIRQYVNLFEEYIRKSGSYGLPYYGIYDKNGNLKFSGYWDYRDKLSLWHGTLQRTSTFYDPLSAESYEAIVRAVERFKLQRSQLRRDLAFLEALRSGARQVSIDGESYDIPCGWRPSSSVGAEDILSARQTLYSPELLEPSLRQRGGGGSDAPSEPQNGREFGEISASGGGGSAGGAGGGAGGGGSVSTPDAPTSTGGKPDLPSRPKSSGGVGGFGGGAGQRTGGGSCGWKTVAPGIQVRDCGRPPDKKPPAAPPLRGGFDVPDQQGPRGGCDFVPCMRRPWRDFADMIRCFEEQRKENEKCKALKGGGSPDPGTNPFIGGPPDLSNLNRFHTGGLPGLRQDEVLAILQKGEEVIPRDDPRHILNTAATSSGGASVKIINTLDANMVLSEALATEEGQQLIVNTIDANSDAVKEVLR